MLFKTATEARLTKELSEAHTQVEGSRDVYCQLAGQYTACLNTVREQAKTIVTAKDTIRSQDARLVVSERAVRRLCIILCFLSCTHLFPYNLNIHMHFDIVLKCSWTKNEKEEP